MLTDIKKAQYLKRIMYLGDVSPTVATLKAVHKFHVYHIPFENLDISLGEKIILSENQLFEKIITRRRGGFCYEVNYIFFVLLQSLGFDVKLLSASVFNGISYGKPFDHMLILVECEGHRLIADVGFGDSFREPLFFDGTGEKQFDADYNLEKIDDNYILYQKKNSQEWQIQYIFSLVSYHLEDFNSMCAYHQNSSESIFKKKSICTIATQKGRKTLSNGRFIVATESARSEHAVSDEAEYRDILDRHFSIQLSRDVDITKLLTNENYSTESEL